MVGNLQMECASTHRTLVAAVEREHGHFHPPVIGPSDARTANACTNAQCLSAVWSAIS